MERRSASESSQRWFWTLLVVIALWWPSRLLGILDGIPFTSVTEAATLGLGLPALCFLAPAFLLRRATRLTIVAILLWKIVSSATLVQDGWCVRMMPVKPYVADGTGAPHSWDVRADWRSPDPKCTAVMTRGFKSNEQFPVWFFNLSYQLNSLPEPDHLPPLAKTLMTIEGTLVASREQVLKIVHNDVLSPEVTLDGARVSVGGVSVAPGEHWVRIETWLTGEQWRFEPLLNDTPVWKSALATMTRPSVLDRFLRPWAAWIVDVAAGIVIVAWLVSYVRKTLNVDAAIWIVSAAGVLLLCAQYVPQRYWHFVLAGLIVVCAVRIPPSMRTAQGAFVLIGIPWLALVIAANAEQFGRMTFYTPGDDWWTFQRFAYRIYLQGYWLEGGEPTFWYQPLYRWIGGALHLLFSDSSVGEALWDGVCVAFMSLFAYVVVSTIADFRWGLAATVLTLASFVGGPSFTFVGRGLSEISSAGFLYLAALFAMRGHERPIAASSLAGAFATLGTYTRLNNLPMSIGVAAFAWPLSVTTAALRRPIRLLREASWPPFAGVIGGLCVGALLFALRTWHYRGVFSIVVGTQSDRTLGPTRNIWIADQPLSANLYAIFDSVMMVLTTTDPPQIHATAMPVLAGAAIAVLAIFGVGLLGRLPLAPVLFCLSSIAGAIVARGSAYPGRFSIHVVPAAVTVLMCALAIMWSWTRSRLGLTEPRDRSASPAATHAATATQRRWFALRQTAAPRNRS